MPSASWRCGTYLSASQSPAKWKARAAGRTGGFARASYVGSHCTTSYSDSLLSAKTILQSNLGPASLQDTSVTSNCRAFTSFSSWVSRSLFFSSPQPATRTTSAAIIATPRMAAEPTASVALDDLFGCVLRGALAAERPDRGAFRFYCSAMALRPDLRNIAIIAHVD